MDASCRLLVVVAAAALAVIFGGPAGAHAERQSSTPRPGSVVRGVPGAVEIRFSEPPTNDVSVIVEDGCRRNVVRGVDIDQTTLVVEVGAGQPGRWVVRTDVISGLDGHPTRDTWRFRVGGDPDCAAAAPGPEDSPRDESSLGPVIAVAIATVGLAAVALALRWAMSR